MPGDFNMACSTLFGGYYYDTYNASKQIPPGSGKSMFGMSKDHARQVFEFALAAHCDDALFNRYQTQVATKQVSMESLGELGMEVIAIEMPGEEIQYHYANLPKLEPSGVLRVKSWKIPGTEATKDLTPEERLTTERVTEVVKHYDFWIEEAVLKKMFLGMKFIATVREMSFGVLYMDNCLGAFCSFFEVLPNELMLKHRAFQYTEPRAKEAYDEDLENYKSEPAAQPDADNEQEDEVQNGEHEQAVDQELHGKAKVNEEDEDSKTAGEKARPHDESPNGKQDDLTSKLPRQKWHYEEINGELCFVPYEEPLTDDEVSLDDDDKVDTLVNDHTGQSARYWPAHAWSDEGSSSNTNYLALNPDTDPTTMKLDTWARCVDPADSAHHEHDSPSEDDDEPRPSERVLSSEVIAPIVAEVAAEVAAEAEAAAAADGSDIDLSP